MSQLAYYRALHRVRCLKLLFVPQPTGEAQAWTTGAPREGIRSLSLSDRFSWIYMPYHTLIP